MNLRLKVALTLAVFAAVSSSAAAAISYAITTDRIDAEVDSTLQSYVQRFTENNAVLAAQLCGASTPRTAEEDERHPFDEAFEQLPGLTAQCVSTDGQIISSIGPQDVPPPAADIGNAPANSARTEHKGDINYRVISFPSPTGDVIRIARSMTATHEIIESVRNRLIVAGLGIAVLAGIAGYFVARRTTRTVLQLSRVAEDIATTGNLRVDISSDEPGEVGRLARAFAQMTAALDLSKSQQQQLVQDAGHELRTPVSSLRSNIDTLRRYPDIDFEQRSRLLADLDSEMRELSAVIDELIVMASGDTDDEEMQPVDIDALVRSITERASRRSGRTITVTGTSGDVESKPYLLTRAVSNLVENALKFSVRSIEITLDDNQIVVRDHGPGLAPSDLTLVFDRFYRAPSARSLPGSGLGLAIVRQCMERCGGSVEVSNHPEGGAVFTLRLS